MAEADPTSGFDPTEVEAELCRLPEVTAVRIVTDQVGRPTEVHVLAGAGKAAKQIVRDVQSVALASFGIDLDRRIVSVVQMVANGDGRPALATMAETTARPRIVTVGVESSGPRISVQVTLASGDDECTGFAEGSAAASARLRLLGDATLDALRQLEPAAEHLAIDTTLTARVGAHDVAVVVLVGIDPPHEQHLAGSAIVHQHADDAVVRAVLDATNRRLPNLARDHERA
ncbi:MAG: hypothetical protein ACKOA9_05360 [Actinomycetota bacterium]